MIASQDKDTLCKECSAESAASRDAFEAANPEAGLGDWLLFWDRNRAWRAEQVQRHCREVRT